MKTASNSYLRTNFTKDRLHIFEAAITEYKLKTGIDRLLIVSEAYTNAGDKLNECMALHDRENSSLTEFWRIYEAKKIISESQLFDNMQYYMEYCKRNEYISPLEWLKKHKHF